MTPASRVHIEPVAVEKDGEVRPTLLVTWEDGKPRRFWQRRRWLPSLDGSALIEAVHALGLDELSTHIHMEASLPHGPYCIRADDDFNIYLDASYTAANLSKTLWHELEHGRQSLMFRTGGGFHIVAHYAADEAELSGLGSWYEETAQTSELNHYDLPLFHNRKEAA